MANKYFNECPKCGAHLDPGETCTCSEEKKEPDENSFRIRKADGTYLVISFKKTA